MTHDEFLKAAASESLTAEQSRLLQEHAESCSECTAEAELPAARWWRFNTWGLAIAAVLFLALWLWREAGIRVARERIRSDRAEIAELKSADGTLAQQRARLVGDMVLMSSAGVQLIAMGGSQSASGKLYLDPASHRAVLVAKGLRDTSGASDYRVWLYTAGATAPRSGASFEAVKGNATVSIGEVPVDLKSVTVTLESGSTATQPGADVALSGRVQ
jgi:hypothetical protein